MAAASPATLRKIFMELLATKTAQAPCIKPAIKPKAEIASGSFAFVGASVVETVFVPVSKSHPRLHHPMLQSGKSYSAISPFISGALQLLLTSSISGCRKEVFRGLHPKGPAGGCCCERSQNQSGSRQP